MPGTDAVHPPTGEAGSLPLGGGSARGPLRVRLWGGWRVAFTPAVGEAGSPVFGVRVSSVVTRVFPALQVPGWEADWRAPEGHAFPSHSTFERPPWRMAMGLGGGLFRT